jgi:hypothetical protein
MGDSEPLEMTSRKENQKLTELETDYQPVNWKRVFLAPKYLGVYCVTLPRFPNNSPLPKNQYQD